MSRRESDDIFSEILVRRPLPLEGLLWDKRESRSAARLERVSSDQVLRRIERRTETYPELISARVDGGTAAAKAYSLVVESGGL